MDEEVSRYRNRVVVILATLSASMFVFVMLYDLFRYDVNPSKKFEVVDTYEGCDIIRWYDSQHTAEFKYFMRCK